MPRRFNVRRGLHLGRNGDTDVFLGPEHLTTGIHVLGRTNSGKSRQALSFFSQFIQDRTATTVLFSPKGALGRYARDAAIAAGEGPRLIYFDPAENERVIGYNPLRPNALAPSTQAKAVREAILSAVGIASLDRVQQLARCLYIFLLAARALELTLAEALELVRPGSPLRAAVLPRIRDGALRDALDYFVRLRDARQDELAASTLARLESLVLDPLLRRLLTQQQHALDLGAVLAERRVLVVNLEMYRPIRRDDVKLLGRMLINDLIAHVFSRAKRERSPVYLILDEAHVFATPDLMAALDQGRELGLVPILAHQYLEQLVLEDNDRRLLYSVLTDAPTKIIIGGGGAQDLHALADELFLSEFDPKAIKDEITQLELDPVEERRTVSGCTVSWGSQVSWGVTNTEGRSRSRTTGHAKTRSASVTEAGTISRSTVEAHSRGHSQGTIDAYGSAEMSGTTFGVHEETAASGTAMATGISAGQSSAIVGSEMHGSTESVSEAFTTAKGYAEAYTLAETIGLAATESESTTEGETTSVANSTGHGTNRGGALTMQDVPWHAYEKRRVVSSRTFWTREEYLTVCIQRVMRQRRGEFVIKVPGKPARFLRAPYVAEPHVRTALLDQALARMFALPCYARPEDIEVEAQRRRESLAPPKTALVKPGTAARRLLPATNTQWDFGITVESSVPMEPPAVPSAGDPGTAARTAGPARMPLSPTNRIGRAKLPDRRRPR